MMKSNRPITIAPADQQRLRLIARINGQRPSQAVPAAMRLYYMYNEYAAIERGYDDPVLSPFAEELCRLIGFEHVDDDGNPAIPAHRLVTSARKRSS